MTEGPFDTMHKNPNELPLGKHISVMIADTQQAMGLSNAQMAKLFDVTIDTYGQWKGGKHRETMFMVWQYALEYLKYRQRTDELRKPSERLT